MKKIFKEIIKKIIFFEFFKEKKDEVKWLKKFKWAGGNYKWIEKKILQKEHKDQIENSIFLEIGSRDCLDSLYFIKKFNPKKVFTFEPSRPGILRSMEILQYYHEEAKKIVFCAFALGSKNEIKKFYEFNYKDPLEGNEINIGASSLLKWTSKNYNEKDNHKNIEKDEEIEKTYDVLVRKGDDLDFIQNEKIYLVAMDVEGFEYEVLLGLKETLKKTKFVCLETGFNFPRESKTHEANDVLDFMKDNNFYLSLCSATDTTILPENDGSYKQFNLLFENKN